MGGVVSHSESNNEMVDNLIRSDYIRSAEEEFAFRICNRARYVPDEQIRYAFRNASCSSKPIFLNEPYFYAEVLRQLELRKTLSFLNVGSGTGYLSTLASIILGPFGRSIGIEYNFKLWEYARIRYANFRLSSITFDLAEHRQPVFLCGDIFHLRPGSIQFDRVYVGAAVPKSLVGYFLSFLKINAILVMSTQDHLIKIRRLSANEFEGQILLNYKNQQSLLLDQKWRHSMSTFTRVADLDKLKSSKKVRFHKCLQELCSDEFWRAHSEQCGLENEQLTKKIFQNEIFQINFGITLTLKEMCRVAIRQQVRKQVKWSQPQLQQNLFREGSLQDPLEDILDENESKPRLIYETNQNVFNKKEEKSKIAKMKHYNKVEAFEQMLMLNDENSFFRQISKRIQLLPLPIDLIEFLNHQRM